MIKEAQANVALLTKDESTAAMVNSALNEEGGTMAAALCREFSELISHLKNMSFKAVIVDIDPDPVRFLSKVGTITTMYPEMRVIVVSNSFSNESILHAMQAGARHYLRKDSIAAEIEKVLEQIISDGFKNNTKSGSVVSVLPVSSGCGATTVAVNLANEIRLETSEEILVIDLDNYYSTVAMYLGISTEYGISDILSHKDVVDENLLRSSSYNYMKDFHVLTNTPTMDFVESGISEYDNITSVLEVCKNAYRYTLIDVPSRLDRTVIEKLVDISEAAVVVFRLTVKDLKLAKPLLSLLKAVAAPEKIIPVANQFEKQKALLGLKDCREALGLNSLYSIRKDCQKTLDSFNLSQPLGHFAPKAKIRRDFQELTSNVINVSQFNPKY